MFTHTFQQPGTSKGVQAVFRDLSPAEAAVLQLRFGLGQRCHTLEEAAAVLGLRKGTARQLEQRALHKLRSLSMRSGSQDRYLDWDEA